MLQQHFWLFWRHDAVSASGIRCTPSCSSFLTVRCCISILICCTPPCLSFLTARCRISIQNSLHATVLVFSDGTMAASVIRCTPTGWSFPRSSKTPQIRNPYSRWNCLRCVSLFKACFFWKFLKGLWCIFLPNELLLFQRPSYEGRFKSRWHFPSWPSGCRADYIFHQLPCCHLLCRGYCPVKACPGFSCHATWIQCTALGLSQGDGLTSLQVCFCHVCACLLFVFGMFTWHQFASAVLKLAVISIFPWTSAVWPWAVLLRAGCLQLMRLSGLTLWLGLLPPK